MATRSGEKLSDLRQQQVAFAAHIRDPEVHPPPNDIEDRRMTIYRELFFNNINAFLSGYFPIAKSIVGDERWAVLVRGFYRDHASRTPLFTELACEFLNYLANERIAPKDEPPFITELAHYEWVEGALNLAADPESDEKLLDGDLLKQAPQVSPLAWLLSYHWPVHEISAAQQPTAELDTPIHFLVYRNAVDQVVFNRLNTMSACLLQLIYGPDNTTTGSAALKMLARQMQHPEEDKLISAGSTMLSEWRAKNIILGTHSV